MKRISLTELSKNEMSKVKFGAVSGSCTCACACGGPSSDIDNGCANRDSGKSSPGGGVIYLDEVVIIGYR